MPDEVTNAELSRSLIRIESKLDRVNEDHETRLRRVERALYISLGLAGAGSASGLGALLTTLIGG